MTSGAPSPPSPGACPPDETGCHFDLDFVSPAVGNEMGLASDEEGMASQEDEGMADTSSATPSTSSVTSSSASENEESDSSWVPSPIRRPPLECSQEGGTPRRRKAESKRKWSKVPREAQLTRDVILRGRCVTWQPRVRVKTRERNTGCKPRKRTLGEMGPEPKRVRKGTAAHDNMDVIRVDSSDDGEMVHDMSMGVERSNPSADRPLLQGVVSRAPSANGDTTISRAPTSQCVPPAIELLTGLGRRMSEWEEVVLSEAEKVLTRQRQRGMGLIQWHARRVRDTWNWKLQSLRMAFLQEHTNKLKELYEDCTRAALQKPPAQCAAGTSEGHWLACDEISRLWDNLMGEVELPMDDPVAYDMVLEHMLYVKGGRSTRGVEDRRQHYVVVNSAKSNESGNHWGLAVWDGCNLANGVIFVDPYEDPWRFTRACQAAERKGLKAEARGAGQQTCGWRCGYICLWWAMWLGRRGEIPYTKLPGLLPKMQGSFPRLCHSLLTEAGDSHQLRVRGSSPLTRNLPKSETITTSIGPLCPMMPPPPPPPPTLFDCDLIGAGTITNPISTLGDVPDRQWGNSGLNPCLDPPSSILKNLDSWLPSQLSLSLPPVPLGLVRAKDNTVEVAETRRTDAASSRQREGQPNPNQPMQEHLPTTGGAACTLSPMPPPLPPCILSPNLPESETITTSVGPLCPVMPPLGHFSRKP